MTQTAMQFEDGPETPQTVRPRLPLVDVARGIAVLAMIVYHSGWDLSYFRLISVDVTSDFGWRTFSHLIAGSFLFLSGVSLALAHTASFRMRPFLTRLAKLALAALIVTVATYIVFPDSYIFFGILHCLAATSIFALPFLYVPLWLAAAAAVLAAILPTIVSAEFLDLPINAWLGLSDLIPQTNDYAPLFPWLGAVLFGTVCGRFLLARHAAKVSSPSELSSPEKQTASRWLIWTGRHSLPIYLLHQPILIGVTAAIAFFVIPSLPEARTPFAKQCVASCVTTGAGRPVCTELCVCTETELVRQGYSKEIETNNDTPEFKEKVGAIARQCLPITEKPQ